MTEYDPRDDSRRSYDVAVEAKRLRGGTHWPERQSPVAPPKKELRAQCGGCAHIWVVAYLPMELTKAATLMKNAACPSCASKSIFLAPENKSDG